MSHRAAQPSPPSPRRPIHRRGLPLLVSLLLLLVPPPEATAQELVTDRPDFTESALTITPGRVQVEAGASVAEADGSDALAVGEVLVRIGLAERWELRLAPGSYERVEPRRGPSVDGLGDSSVGVKVTLPELARLFPRGARPDVAVIADADLPTGDDDLGEDGVRPGAILSLGWDLSPRVGLGVNLGYRRAREGGERFDQPSASVAVGLAAGERLSLFGEWFAVGELEAGTGPAPDTELVHHVDGGLTWLVNPDFQLDAFVGFGVSDAAPDHFAGVGFAARF